MKRRRIVKRRIAPSGLQVDHRAKVYICTYRIARRARCGRRGKWDGKNVRCVFHREEE